MRKMLILMISAVLICMMSGCSDGKSAKEQTVASVTPICTVAPTEEPISATERMDQSAGEEKPSLQSGFEAVGKTEVVIAVSCGF